MARIVLSEELQSTMPLASYVVDNPTTVSAALVQLFAEYPRLAGYLLDDRGTLRERVAIYVDGGEVQDVRRLTDAVGGESEIRVMRRLGPRTLRA